MSLLYSTTGRPFVQCPVCKKIHPVHRRRNYKKRPPKRWKCDACQTMWRSTEEERQEILAYYEINQSRGKGRPRVREKAVLQS